MSNISKNGRSPATMAINSANAFFGLAGGFFSEIPPTLHASAAFAVQRLGRLTAAVTNLSLAIELYLKGFALATGTKASKTHDLLTLFNALPKALQTSIEREYESRQKRLATASLTAIELVITSTEREPTESEVEKASGFRPIGTDIRAVLGAEKDAFRTWRYLYEAGNPNEIFFVRVDYGRLGLIVNSLQAQIKGVTQPAPQKSL